MPLNNSDGTANGEVGILYKAWFCLSVNVLWLSNFLTIFIKILKKKILFHVFSLATSMVTHSHSIQMVIKLHRFFSPDCRPSCIAIILIDHPNLVLKSEVRPTVKDQIVIRNFYFKNPPPHNYPRKLWHFNRARPDLIGSSINWKDELQNFEEPTNQVDFFNECLLNIMAIFVPNETKKSSSWDPPWLSNEIKQNLRRQNDLYRKLKRNGFKCEDKAAIDTQRKLCSEAVLKGKLPQRTR